MRKKIHVKGLTKGSRKTRKNLQKQVLQYRGLVLCPKQFKSITVRQVYIRGYRDTCYTAG